MASGYAAKHAVELPLAQIKISEEHFLVLALEAARKLNWEIGPINASGFVAFTKFSIASSSTEEVLVSIDNGFANLRSESTGGRLVDWSKNKKNINQLLATFDQLRETDNTEELSAKYEELSKSFSSQDSLAAFQPNTSKKTALGLFSIFIPRKGFFITPLLVDLNLLVFILMVINGAGFWLPDSESLIKWGANFRPVTLQGELWRILSCCFVHIGIVHLTFNMYALIYIGMLLEPILGNVRTITAYLLTGIAASTASLVWHPLTISAGASGAIFGLYGVFLALLTTDIVEKSARKALLTSIGIFVAYNLVNGMKGGIDNSAHLGGLACGFIIGFAYTPGLKNPRRTILKYPVIIVMAIAVTSSSFLISRGIPNDFPRYDELMHSFASNESQALEVLKLPNTTPKDQILSEIKDRSLYYWNEDITLVNEMEKLNIPKELHERDKKLLEYCNFRVNSYSLIYKTVDEGTDKYRDSIKYYNEQIVSIFDDLQKKNGK